MQAPPRPPLPPLPGKRQAGGRGTRLHPFNFYPVCQQGAHTQKGQMRTNLSSSPHSAPPHLSSPPPPPHLQATPPSNGQADQRLHFSDKGRRTSPSPHVLLIRPGYALLVRPGFLREECHSVEEVSVFHTQASWTAGLLPAFAPVPRPRVHSVNRLAKLTLETSTFTNTGLVDYTGYNQFSIGYSYNMHPVNREGWNLGGTPVSQAITQSTDKTV